MFDLENNRINMSRIQLTFDTFSKRFTVSQNIKVCLTLKGNGIWQISNRLYSVTKGDIVILNNRQQRVFREVSLLDGIELLTVNFDPRFILDTPFMGLVFRNDEYECMLTGSPAINRLFVELEREYNARLLHYEYVMNAKLVELLALLRRQNYAPNANEVHIDSDMYKVLEYINANYTRNISLKETAGYFGMSESGFSKYFSRCFKMGFAKYIIHKRINYAVHLVRETNKTVLEIALECGFNNAASFYKAFKNVTGKTPMDYKRS